MTGLGLGFFIFTIYIAYAYAFFFGGIWVNAQFSNDTYSRPYKAGDIISIFFVVLFGLFSGTGSTQHLNAIADGKAAGKLAFDVIDRAPAIN